MKIVTNSTPLIELSKIQELDLLRKVYDSIIISEEVYNEVVVDGSGKHGAEEVKTADWIQRHSVTNKNLVIELQRQNSLHLGECSTIVLAKEIDAEQVILDDNAARSEAIAQGLPVIGTVGVLLIAKNRLIIPKIKPILDKLRAQGTRISDSLYLQLLTESGE